MPIILPALIGAVVGAGITLFFNIWKFHRDERAARCDELCKAIQEAATVALSYWTTAFPKPEEQVVAETKLRAAQDLVELLFEDFITFISVSNEETLSEMLSDFTSKITGGQYTEIGRGTDLERAKMTGPLANRLSVHLRRSNRETLPFHAVILAFHKNKRRTLSMPIRRCGGDWS